MAIFERRAQGQWRARVRRKGHPELSRTFTLRKDAEHWARTVELGIERGDLVDLQAQRVTFREVANRYKAEVSPLKRSGKGEGYRINRLVERFGDFSLSAIRPLDVAKFRDERLALGNSGQTVIHDLNTLSAIWQHCRKEWGVQLSDSPVGAIRKPAKGEGRSRRVSASEVNFLLRSADQSPAHGLRAIIELAVATSCRLGELIGLNWANVDLRGRTMHLSDTKNGDSRTVALSKAAVATFTSLPRHLSGRVFYNWASSDSFQATWKKCVSRARKLNELETHNIDAKFLADFRFHDLRHEATSRLFERGLNVFEVRSMTGHKSIQMLARYTHVEAGRLAEKLG